MRQTISGLVAAVAVMTAGAAPAMACGFGACSPCGVYASPCAPVVAPTYGYSYTGCTAGCGWGYERLVSPTTQYYYVNQGPTYSGPGAFAPYPTYEEGGYYYRPYRYRYLPRVTYGSRYYGRPVLRRYY
jgi:hypothetical protein